MTPFFIRTIWPGFKRSVLSDDDLYAQLFPFVRILFVRFGSKEKKKEDEEKNDHRQENEDSAVEKEKKAVFQGWFKCRNMKNAAKRVRQTENFQLKSFQYLAAFNMEIACLKF